MNYLALKGGVLHPHFPIKMVFAVSLLVFTAFNVFPEEHGTGKMLIMGWEFVENDSSLQTNIAIEAITKYAEAAKYQMMSEERYNPSCRMELYKENYFYDYESYRDIFHERVFIYITVKNEDDYRDRYIEINFYTVRDGLLSRYKLVMNYNNYRWLKNNDEKDMWELVMRDEPAYDFFISWVENLKK
jgi:hypothetical protein